MKRRRGDGGGDEEGWDGEEGCERGAAESFALLEGEWEVKPVTGLLVGQVLPDLPAVVLDSQVRCLAGRRVGESEREVHALTTGGGEGGWLQRVRLPGLGAGPGGAGLVRGRDYGSCVRRAAARRDAARNRADARAPHESGRPAPPVARAQEAADWFLRVVLRAERGVRIPRGRLRELLGPGVGEAVLDGRVAELMRLGALLRVERPGEEDAGTASEEAFWIGVPNAGPLCVAVAEGRRALCAALAACDRGTAHVRQLLAGTAGAKGKRRGRVGKGAPVRLLLPPKFLLRDCIGSGRIERVPGPLGVGMVRLPKHARH